MVFGKLLSHHATTVENLNAKSRNAVQLQPTKEVRMLQTMPSGIYRHQEALLDGITSAKSTKPKCGIDLMIGTKKTEAGKFVAFLCLEKDIYIIFLVVWSIF